MTERFEIMLCDKKYFVIVPIAYVSSSLFSGTKAVKYVKYARMKRKNVDSGKE